MSDIPPSFHDILAAAARIAPHARVTPVLRSRSLDALAGAELHFKCENFQRVGAFKFRGACNAVWSLDDAEAANGVVTHSSGNHGAALALAARTRGIPAHVVVPEGAVKSKVAAIETYGAIVHRCAPTQAAREALAAQLQATTGARLVHPFTDPAVIAGQGTATLELLSQAGTLDAVIAPVGGGGLASGTAIAARGLAPATRVFAAEPEGAPDAYESLRRGERVSEQTPDTICDGLRTIIGAPNFALLQAHAVEVLLVSDADTLAAMRLVWERLKILVEPSCATVLAAVLRHREQFAGPTHRPDTVGRQHRPRHHPFPPEPVMNEETIQWRGHPSQWRNFWWFLSCLLVLPIPYAIWKWLETRNTVYTLTDQRLQFTRGVLSKATEDLELYRVRDTKFHQGFIERLLDLGDIVLYTTDASTPVIALSFIQDADGVREIIRRLVEARRDAKRVRSLDIGNDDANVL